MKQLTFIQVRKDNDNHCAEFVQLFRDYIIEDDIDLYERDELDMQALEEWMDSIIEMQGDSDRHLELCYDGEKLVGFLYGKVDHENHNGFIKPGWGYVMEFYVKPEYRRQGYGYAMMLRLEGLLAADGTTQLYLQVGSVLGAPFWTRLGFCETDEVSPENDISIWVKTVE
ncbi:MAG: GNAT family N-acetyltransferase [Lachnospiraceae bacterium]|nr:GNAT family N-acetyltransferase [Lachnospiraceae bacterium]